MLKTKIIRGSYQNILKPILFLQDPELVHNSATHFGEFLGTAQFTKKFTSHLLKYSDRVLEQNIAGIQFTNPIGLAAGFDYNGYLAEILSDVGFGFNTVGTITAKHYEGNKHPRLKRLPKSKSLLVNKGFKSIGVAEVTKLLQSKDLSNSIVGASVGSSNLPTVNTIKAAISDYIESFQSLQNEKYIKYFELNISCPNTAMTEGFCNTGNLAELLTRVSDLNLSKPVFIKMPNELDLNATDSLVRTSLNFKQVSGFIFSNLVKDRTNSAFDADEIKSVENLKGNFSGRPTYKNSNNLIHHMYKEYGKATTIIGCGGIFSANDAYEKIKHGASLVQLITGMIYEGPQLIGEINEGLVKLLRDDGFKNISEAVGAYHR